MMKKTSSVLLLALVLLLIPTVSLGLNTPTVSEGHGVIIGAFVSDHGLNLGAEYGITPEFGVTALFGGFTKIGIKYELNPSLALVGGAFDSNPFLGLNGSFGLSKDLLGLYEVDLSMAGGDFQLIYSVGAKLRLAKKVDLRAGVMGYAIGSDTKPHLALGIGYQF